MTKQEDFIWNQIYRGALSGGASEKQSKDHAIMGLEEFRRKGFGKEGALKFVERHIKEAKKVKQ